MPIGEYQQNNLYIGNAPKVCPTCGTCPTCGARHPQPWALPTVIWSSAQGGGAQSAPIDHANIN